jgi:hypothetical protein
MPKEVKIIWFHEGDVYRAKGYSTPNAEKVIADLLNQGWVIVTAGGGGTVSRADEVGKEKLSVHGFVVLQRG